MAEEALKSEIMNIDYNKTIDDGFACDEDLEIINLLQSQIDNDKFLIYNHEAFAMLKTRDNMKILSDDKKPNYLGYLSLHRDNTHIDLNIKSKFSVGNHLLNYMLSKVYDFNGEILTDNLEGINDLIFINAYRNAIKKGIFRKYIEVEYNDSKIKGKIDVARHIQINQSIQGKVAYSTREYSPKNNVNRLILKTYNLLDRKNDKLLRRVINNDRDVTKGFTQLKNIITNVDEYTNEQVIGKGNEKISNMVYKEYETLRKISKALLKSKGRYVFEENDVRLNGVLFNPDYL
ncbi:MAG: McrC family protein [Clostridia bacterium]|nr:McrC family protein [Clostridia bacterium]